MDGLNADSPGDERAEEPLSDVPERRAFLSPTDRMRLADRAHRRMLLSVRLLYMVLLVTVALLPFVGEVTKDANFTFGDYAGAFLVTIVFGAAILLIDAATPNKKLASVFGIYLGIIAGLVGALAIGTLLDLIAQSWDLQTNPWVGDRGLVKLAIGITLCYLAVSIVLTTKDDFRLVIPYVEFSKQVRGVRPLLLDTSALIDGRIDDFAQTGFLDAPLVLPQFVINELQTLADSSDRLKRARGRRGLDMVNSLQANALVDLSIDPAEGAGHSVDHLLLRMAGEQNLRILTTDYNLNKVAKIQDITVLNLNDLANTLRPQVIAGDHITIGITKVGESPDQGVGYLPDGTMVVVENASERIGENVGALVTNVLQTSAGRMIFARFEDDGEPAGQNRDGSRDGDRVEKIAETATHQERVTTRAPARRGQGATRRNPRR